MTDEIVKIMVGVLAGGVTCDFEDCPGHRPSAKKRLIYNSRYLFVHPGCVKGARASSKGRNEVFGFRSGL